MEVERQAEYREKCTRMKVEAAAAAANPVPGSGPTADPTPVAGSEPAAEGAAHAFGGEPPAEEPPVAEPPPVQQRAPMEEPEAEVLEGEKGRQRDELWAVVSVSMQQQGESPRMGDSMFGLLIEPAEPDDGSSLDGNSSEEEDQERKEDDLERDVERGRQAGFVQQEPQHMSVERTCRCSPGRRERQ